MHKLRSLITTLALAAALSPAAYGASASKAFTVTNTGNGPLTISGASISGNPAEFALAGNTCTSVAAGGSCAMTVTFTPNGSGTRQPASLNFSSNGTNGPTHSIALAGTGGSACAAGTQVYSYTGVDQVIQVPSGCSTATIKAWGAGGRAGSYTNPVGGGGGFAQRVVTSLTAGSNLVVVVGQGATSLAATYGGGGAGGQWCIVGCTVGGAGGGLSGVFLGTKAHVNSLVIAGGGGGSTGSDGGAPGNGGAGGGSAGLAGGNYSATAYTGAGGGTSSAGGAAGGGLSYWGTAGGALQGGAGLTNGGGGGYWGGGGAYYSGAGGGSGYAPGGILIAGNGCTVANFSDSDYVAGIGNGGCTKNTSGQNGRVVIIWQ